MYVVHTDFCVEWSLVVFAISVEGANTSKYEGALPQNGIYKKLCIYFYMFKLQSPSKYSPCDAIHLVRQFSTA